MRMDLRTAEAGNNSRVIIRRPARMSGKMVINKLIFRLFFAKELRKMARARQGNCSRPWLSGCERGLEGTGEELGDGLQRGMAVELGGAGDGAVAGVDVCAP